MLQRSRFKQLLISLGLYQPARSIRRFLQTPEQRGQGQAELDFYRSFIEKGDLVFDVGAN